MEWFLDMVAETGGFSPLWPGVPASVSFSRSDKRPSTASKKQRKQRKAAKKRRKAAKKRNK